MLNLRTSCTDRVHLPPIIAQRVLEVGAKNPLLQNLIIGAIPHTEPWNLNTATVMILCNLLAVAICRLTVSNPGVGKPDLFRSFSLTELIATFSFGHLLGVGSVLGLTSLGVI